MQVRELTLKELDIIYEMIELLPYSISYNDFEDLIYEMKEYKMFGIFECDILISYAGVSIETTLFLKRHLKVHEFITINIKNASKYHTEMKTYLQDYAKISACCSIVMAPHSQQEIKYLS